MLFRSCFHVGVLKAINPRTGPCIKEDALQLVSCKDISWHLGKQCEHQNKMLQLRQELLWFHCLRLAKHLDLVGLLHPICFIQEIGHKITNTVIEECHVMDWRLDWSSIIGCLHNQCPVTQIGIWKMLFKVLQTAIAVGPFHDGCGVKELSYKIEELFI